MATSGDTSFTLDAEEMINEAFAILQIGVEGESVTQTMLDAGFKSLNLMLTTWQAQGIHLWTMEDATLFLVGGKESYVLEISNCTNRAITTATSGSFIGNTVALESQDELQVGWNIGFLQSNQEIFWTTVTSISIFVIAVADIPPEEVPVGSPTYYYENPVRPVERVYGLRRAVSTTTVDNETPIHEVSRQEYFDLPNKRSQGIPSEGYYSRQIPEGILYLWPTPQNGATQVKIRYERKLEDFTVNGDTPDLPKYWLESMTYNLAQRLAIKYRVPPAIMADVKEMAEITLNEALNFDNSVYDISVSVNREAR